MAFSIGDRVRPKTPAGLTLANLPVNGEYKQRRGEACVFRGIGAILAKETCVIDYDAWDALDGCPVYDLGQVEYTSYLVRCDAGTGWAGESALDPV